MQKISRRKFVGRTALGMGATLTLANLPAGLSTNLPAGLLASASRKANNMPIGFQTFPIRDQIAKDFPGTLKLMAGMGYQLVEMCSPKGYSGLGFGALVDVKPADMRKIITDSGLTCPSCHFGFHELTGDLDDRIAFAQGLGLSQMICSTFGLPDTATIKDYQESADQLNTIAGKIHAAGMATGFHNHSMEFKQLEGQLIYDALMARFDPALVKMQFQTEVINYGFKASTYFNKYPGRFISSHLSDWTADKKQVPIGQGIIDWTDFFNAAKRGGVKNFFVEMQFDTFKPSAAYIHGL
jgi:sugar phosphate isomerase/epimerase